MFMYPPDARGAWAPPLHVSAEAPPSSLSSCLTSAIESARAMLSARAIESCFDLGAPTWARARPGTANSVSAIVNRVMCMISPENVFYHSPTTDSGFSGRRSAGIGEALGTVPPVPRRTGPNVARELARGHALRDRAWGALSRESGARGARRFIVAVMRVRSALLGMGDRACFIACEAEISAE